MAHKLRILPISKKWLWGGGIIALLAIFLLDQQRGIPITNEPFKNVVSSVAKKANELSSGFIANGTDGTLDPAKELFLDKRSADAASNKEIVKYINQANAAIPLTSEALRFALEGAILGNYDPLKDSISRLKDGELALQDIAPPLDAITFHKMSIALLQEYQRILSIPLNIPREQFDPGKLKGDFARLDVLLSLTKRELQVMAGEYSTSLFPKVIIFYEEVIGKR